MSSLRRLAMAAAAAVLGGAVVFTAIFYGVVAVARRVQSAPTIDAPEMGAFAWATLVAPLAAIVIGISTYRHKGDR